MNGLMIIQRNHNIPNHLDAEMEFWMNEIEKFEQRDEAKREQRGLSPLRRPQARAFDIEDLEKLGNDIYIPEIWMQE